jgi:hypothetical protein
MKCSICKKKKAEYYLKEGNKTFYFCKDCGTTYLLTHVEVNFLPRLLARTKEKTIIIE